MRRTPPAKISEVPRLPGTRGHWRVDKTLKSNKEIRIYT